MRQSDRIYVAGHRGMVGSALVRALTVAGHDVIVRTRYELNLCHQAEVVEFFCTERPTHVFVAAARVGGIEANVTYPASFLHHNLKIASNIIDGAVKVDTCKLLMLGSSCIYPKDAQCPIVEDALLAGALEPTNRPYALAKIASIELCDAYRRQHGKNFISVMPCNLYGPGDRYDDTSHVIPALIHKFHHAQLNNLHTVDLLGTGAPLREFLYVDDLAQACLLCMDEYDEAGPINVGSGEEIPISSLAHTIATMVGYKGEISWTGELDGVRRKTIDSSRIRRLGWRPRVDLSAGLKLAYEDFLSRC